MPRQAVQSWKLDYISKNISFIRLNMSHFHTMSPFALHKFMMILAELKLILLMQYQIPKSHICDSTIILKKIYSIEATLKDSIFYLT